MNEAIEFQEERINALEGRRIIDVAAEQSILSIYIRKKWKGMSMS